MPRSAAIASLPAGPRRFPGAGLRPAFTLIELLVVVAIIAILAGILFPVFARIPWTARKVQCVSNLEQLDKLFQMYAEDNDGRFPVGTDVSWGDMYGLPYRGCPYINKAFPASDAQLWRCPADTGFRWWNADYNTYTKDYSPSCFRRVGQSYAYNLLMLWNQASNVLSPVDIAGVKRPSQTAYLKDAHFMWHNNNSPLLPLRRNVGDTGSFNVLYLDGHAAKYGGVRQWGTSEERAFWTANDPRAR